MQDLNKKQLFIDKLKNKMLIKITNLNRIKLICLWIIKFSLGDPMLRK